MQDFRPPVAVLFYFRKRFYSSHFQAGCVTIIVSLWTFSLKIHRFCFSEIYKAVVVGKNENWSSCIERGLNADAALHPYTVHVRIVSC